jgi:hypothetical protein
MQAMLTDLLARIERAEGPDREIDDAIREVVLGWRWIQDNYGIAYWLLPSGERSARIELAHYTARLDAAIALVEAKLPGWEWQCGGSVRGFIAFLWPLGEGQYSSSRMIYMRGASPALALLSALLRALIAKGDA